MVTSLKQRGCVAAVAFLGMLSLSQAQTIPAPAGPAQVPEPIKPAAQPPMLLVQPPAQAAYPAAPKSTTATTAATVLTDADAAIESGGVGVREFQGDDVGQVVRLLARQAKINMGVSEAVVGTVTMWLEDVTAIQSVAIIVKAIGLFMDKIDNVYYIKTAAERTAEPTESDNYQFSYARAKDVAALIAPQLSTKEAAQVDERTNTLFFRETRSNIDNIRKLLAQVDKPTKQVMIEARLVEVTANPKQAYGINWAGVVGGATNPKNFNFGGSTLQTNKLVEAKNPDGSPRLDPNGIPIQGTQIDKLAAAVDPPINFLRDVEHGLGAIG